MKSPSFRMIVQRSFMVPCFAFLVAAKTAFSQKADFSGNWSLEKRTSLSGTDYANGVPKEIKIILRPDSIIINRVTTGQNGEEISIVESISFDGNPTLSITPSMNKKSSTIKWSANGEEYVETANLCAPDEDKPNRKITYTWSLANDGKTLALIRVDENFLNGETWSMKGVYKKE